MNLKDSSSINFDYKLNKIKILKEIIFKEEFEFSKISSILNLNEHESLEIYYEFQNNGFPIILLNKKIKFIKCYQDLPFTKFSIFELFYRYFSQLFHEPNSTYFSVKYNNNEKNILLDLIQFIPFELIEIIDESHFNWQDLKTDFTLLLPRIRLINEALEQKQMVVFELTDNHNSQKREFTGHFLPLEFFIFNGSYYILAIDQISQKPKPILLEEITKMGIVQKESGIEYNLNFEEWFQNQDLSIFNKKREKIIILITGTVQDYFQKYRYVENDQKLKYHSFNDGTSSLELYIRVSQEVVNYLKTFSKELQILHPEKYQVYNQMNFQEDKKKIAS